MPNRTSSLLLAAPLGVEPRNEWFKATLLYQFAYSAVKRLDGRLAYPAQRLEVGVIALNNDPLTTRCCQAEQQSVGTLKREDPVPAYSLIASAGRAQLYNTPSSSRAPVTPRTSQPRLFRHIPRQAAKRDASIVTGYDSSAT